MRVLFVYPVGFQSRIWRPHHLPLGLSFLASSLERRGHRVSIFDRYARTGMTGKSREAVNEEMLERVRRFKPDVVGFNTLSPLIWDTVECAELIRPRHSGLMMAGGHHASALPGPTLRKVPGLDAVVEGEGEIPMARLCDGEALDKIPGLWRRSENGPVIGAMPQRVGNLDDLPFPDFSGLEMSFYTKPSLVPIRGRWLSTLSMLTSRGCSKSCDFCAESLTYGKGVRFHSVEYVIEWMKKATGDYPVEGVYFHDNDFLLDEDRARAICEKMIDTGLHRKLVWAIQTGVARINGEILKLLKRAGCVLVELGVEASLQEQLDSMHKGTKVVQNERAIALCRREGLSVHAYMITCFPGESTAELEQRLNWLRKTKPDSFQWSPLQVLPGTALYSRAGNGFFENSEWTMDNIRSFYGAPRLCSMSPEEYAEWMERNFAPYRRRRHYINLLGQNSPTRLIRFAGARIRRELERFLTEEKKENGHGE